MNFLEQVKAPILASQLFQKYPNRLWQHHTLHYSGPDIEAWGLNAACLYFSIRAFDAQRLFWPAGSSYALELIGQPRQSGTLAEVPQERGSGLTHKWTYVTGRT